MLTRLSTTSSTHCQSNDLGTQGNLDHIEYLENLDYLEYLDYLENLDCLDSLENLPPGLLIKPERKK